MSQWWPVVEEISSDWTPEAVFGRLVREPHCLFFDSAMRHPELGRYSFVTADPFEYWEVEVEGPDALAKLADRLNAFPTQTVPGLPPFQGGAAGLFAYELGRQWERLPKTRWDEFRVPGLAVGLYDVVVAFDHREGRAWIISQGFPEQEASRRTLRARQRLQEWKHRLLSPGRPPENPTGHGRELVALDCRFAQETLPRRERPGSRTSEPGECSDNSLPRDPKTLGNLLPERNTGGVVPNGRGRILSVEELAPGYPVPGLEPIVSNFTPEGYQEAVQQVIEYIRAGDVFQVNLSQRLLAPDGQRPWEVYLRLRAMHPAPFAGYFDLGDFQILSASPERFLCVRDRCVETRPIKGTRPRTGHAEQDRQTMQQLLASPKERAENVMIVDLLRNDLARVCRPESVRVSQLCELETYARVFHLVSAVRGELRTDCSLVDLIRACFPGGSVTGAPKVRAMEIIAELEGTARGAYCGSLGYLGFDGAMDMNILIRTITAGRGWRQLHVGGGVTVLSDPQQEYEETWHKAQGLLQAMRCYCQAPL